MSKIEPSPSPSAAAEFEVFCGIDVARETHHAVALDPAGERLTDRPLPNAEPDLVELFEELEAHGRVLVVVDQLASIGALAIAVARSAASRSPTCRAWRCDGSLTSTPATPRPTPATPTSSPTPPAPCPHALRRVGFEEHTTVELAVLAGYDADLANESTRLTNRLHDALLHVHPALERLLGKHFRRRGVLRLLAATGTPASIAALGHGTRSRRLSRGVTADRRHPGRPDPHRAGRADA